MMGFKMEKRHSKGFTLVEIIVTIVAAGILGAIFVNFMGTALESSWNSVEIARDESGVEFLMEQIISEYVVDMNNNPANALNNIVTTYGGQTINGITITTGYVTFDAGGNEQPGGNDYLKVVLQPTGPATPAISGRYPLTTIFANNRQNADDHFVLF
jgi:prepilin-type N-terminal cleavage/methylation domain-containing protein